MSKKILIVIMSLVVSASIVGCGNKDNNTASSSTSSNASTEESSATPKTVTSEDENLEGSWAKNYNLKKFKSLYEEKLAKIKEITEEAGIESQEDDEKVKTEDDLFITENSLSFNNDGAQENKIENFYFGQKLYGDDSSSGVIELKVVLKINSENIVKDNFDLGNTTIAKYIAAFSGQENRDYSAINKEILDKFKAGEKEITITNTVDGLKEEIIADNGSIFYKLSTKKYDFTAADETLQENIEAQDNSKSETTTEKSSSDSNN